MQDPSGTKVGEVLTDYRKARSLSLHMWRHFSEDRCLDEAASLSYTSLLSLVPLLAVMFGIASSVPVFNEWSVQLKEFVYDNLVPTSSVQIDEYLDQFLASVNKLTFTGAFFLIFTALMLMMRIERSLNLIWRTTSERAFINKLTMYWAVLTLGPLALGAATALSAQPLFEFAGVDSSELSSFRGIGIFVLTWVAFTLMFLLVPNCKVPIPYAAFGSLVTTGLFTVAKLGFAAFIARASYSVLYGALATIPIFLLWLYIVWATILLGASLAASLTTFNDRRSDWSWPAAWEFLLVYRLLGHFHEAQVKGGSLTTTDLLDLEPGVPSSRMQRILVRLMEENLITQDQEQGWVLKRDLAHYTLADLYAAGDYHLPIGKQVPVPSASKWDKTFIELLQQENLQMNQSLESLFQGSEVSPASS
jgi:membrane protein